MIATYLLTQPEGGGQVEQIARTFGVDWPHLAAQTISFSIVCALLYWLAYRPILRMLEARRQQIAQGLANAEKIAAELAKTETQRREVLAQANLEAKAFIDAREAAAQERARLAADLKREMGRLVLQTTATVTGKILTPDDQRRLAEETARQLSGSAGNPLPPA